ncbi:MAG: GH3 auxin-responsive promoter family protein [Candidatus Paceibacterota bacterium]
MFRDTLSYIFREFIILRTKQLDSNDQRANLVQKSILFWLILNAQNTRFGKQHKFLKIRSIKDFQKNVPISHYVNLENDIIDMLAGKSNILWPGKTHFFAKSSATTSLSKYIPVTKNALYRCHFKGGKDMVAFYLKNNPETKIFTGKVLSLCGTFYPYEKNPEVETGDISAIITKNLPLSAQLFRFPGPELALRDGWESKIEKISELAIKQNITAIVGVPMWTIVFIKKVLEKSGKKSIFEVWPNLEVFMHGGISFKPYRKIFNELFEGRNIKYIESYNASEGYFAIQDDMRKENEMRLIFDYGVFYEFIPLVNYEKNDYTALTISEIKLNINYVLVITTNSGLWRYIIGDTIMFTSLSPYRIKITGRTKQYLNTYDEEITVDNVENAIEKTCKETNSQVENFTMSATLPDKEGRGSHEWVIEFDKEPDDLNKFIKILDKKLIEENNDYASRRVNDCVLRLPIVHSVKKGTFYNWMKKNDRLGGQFKVQRVSNGREYIDGILNSISL